MRNFKFIFIIGFFLLGCSPTRYFEPNKNLINGDLKYSGDISSSIKETSINGATLKDQQILSKDGLENIKTNRGDLLLNKQNGKYLITNIDGKFKIMDSNSKILYAKDFNSTSVVAASIEGDKLALVTTNNTLYLIDLLNNKTLLEDSRDIVLAVDSRMADPVFTKDVILYPTLDGKIVIVDKNGAKELKEFVVSSDIVFNNVLGINFIGKGLYAYTATNLMLISPTNTKNYKARIRKVLFNNNKIYAFLKNGSVVMLDPNLNTLASKEFKYAIFIDAFIYKNRIYIVEKTGYVIVMDLNLNSSKIYKFDEIDDKVFTRSKEGIFYQGNKFIKF